MMKPDLNKKNTTHTLATFVSGAAFLILILNLIFFSQLYFSGELKYQGSILETSGAVTALPEIVSEMKVSQTFFVDHDGLSSVAIQVGTFMRKNDVHLLLTLTNDAGKVLRDENFSLLKHGDNSFLKFSFEPITDSKGKTMTISISSPDSSPGNAVTVWTTGTDSYLKGKLRLNDEYLSSDLVLSVKYSL
jgi:hypothetical protein